MPSPADQIPITDITDDIDRRDRTFRRFGTLLSIFIHCLFVALLFLPETQVPLPEQPPPPIEVDLVPAPPPAPEPQPTPPHPVDIPPEAALPPPPPPQLDRAQVARKSSAPSRQGETKPAAADKAPPREAPKAPPVVAFSFTPQGASVAPDPGGGGGVPLRQSEEDFVLAQILKYWRLNFRPTEASDGVLTAVIYIAQDGTLSPPLNKNGPWNPGAVISNYQELVMLGTSIKRDVLEGFYMALRLCQPLELPGVDAAHWPKRVVVRFSLKDVWQKTGGR